MGLKERLMTNQLCSCYTTNLWVCHKSQGELAVHGQIIWIAPDGGDNDNTALLSLEFLHRAYTHIRKLPCRQHFLDLLDLSNTKNVLDTF